MPLGAILASDPLAGCSFGAAPAFTEAAAARAAAFAAAHAEVESAHTPYLASTKFCDAGSQANVGGDAVTL